jgi:ring-1,2-phenylacetyl-CoA epoxidase subunit PaaC
MTSDEWLAGRRPETATSGITSNPHFEYLLRLADDRLVLGHRLSEWCGHGPILEEDIALGNIALDLIGQASALLKHAGTVEGKGRNEDALAYFRDAIEYRNCLLVELPRGDFAFTVVRQFLFDAFDVPLMHGLGKSQDATLGGIAAKAEKEARYHLRHSAEWVRMLGDGTDESHSRAQTALNELWRYTSEMFAPDDVERHVVERGIGVDAQALYEGWQATVRPVFADATLSTPDITYPASGGRTGRHSEHLGHMLAEMQSLARAHPNATW